GVGGPFGNRDRADPNVFRIRDLLAEDWRPPLAELTYFNDDIWTHEASPDGGYFIIAGPHDRPKQARAIKVFRGTDGAELHSISLMADAGVRFDPHCKFMTIDNEDGRRVELRGLPECNPLRFLPAPVHHLGPGTRYWANINADGPGHGPGLSVHREDLGHLLNL